MKSFVKQFVALVEGDSAEATAQKTFRAADSSINTHIAVLTGDLIAKEDAVTAAEENLQRAKVNNGQMIIDRDQYIKNLFHAKNTLVEAEEALDDHIAKIEFLSSVQTELEAEV